MAKGIKKSVIVLAIFLCTIYILLLNIILLLNNSRVSTYLAQKFCEIAEQTLDTKVRVDKVTFAFPNRVALEAIYIEDQSGDTLLYGQSLSAKAHLSSLLIGRLEFKKIAANNLMLHLSADSTNTLNIQFLLDALKSDKPKSNLSFRFNEIALTNCDFCYHKTVRHDAESNDKKFNANDIRLHDINTVIEVNEFSKRALKAKIKSLSLEEQSGLAIKHLYFEVDANDSVCLIPGLAIAMNHSQITLDTTVITYNGVNPLKEGLNTLSIKTEILPSTLRPSDLSPLAPQLTKLNLPLTLSGKASGRLDNIRAKELTLRYGKDIIFEGDMQLSGLPNFDETFVFANINRLQFNTYSIQDLIANLTQKPFVLSKELHNLGTCVYRGNISGFFSNIVLYGRLNTGIGKVSTDVSVVLSNDLKDIELNGRVAATKLRLSAITPQNLGLGDLTFTSTTRFVMKERKFVTSRSKLDISEFTFRNYTYHDIAINGDYANRTFTGKIKIDDENGKLDFKGSIDLNKEFNKFHFAADISDFSPYNLNLITTNRELRAGLHIRSNFEGGTLANLNGMIRIDSILLENNRQRLFFEGIKITSVQNGSSSVEVVSDLINGKVYGNYNTNTLKNSMLTMLSKDMPILKQMLSFSPPSKKNNLRFLFEIAPTTNLAHILELPWNTPKTTTISGYYNDTNNQFNVELGMPELSNGSRSFTGINLRLNNEERGVVFLAHAQAPGVKDTINVYLTVRAKNDTVKTQLDWENTNEKVIAGELYLKSFLYKEKDSLYCNTRILPTEIIIKNSAWNIEAASLHTNFKWLQFNGFNLYNELQHITINGTASKSMNDQLDVSLKNIDLDYISSLLPAETSISFGGSVTGEAEVYSAFGTPVMNADVLATDFAFNNARLGTTHATSTWNNDTKKLGFTGTVVSDSNDTTAVIDGGYYVGNDSLDIKGVANKLDLRFLNYYLSTVLQNVQGYGTGTVHIYGITKQKTITVEADAYAEHAQVSIDFLKTTYFFSDSIKLTKDRIILDNINITDQEGNKGLLNGSLSHNYFKEMAYKIDILLKNSLVMNTKKTDNSAFYGKVYATGRAVIEGLDNDVTITCAATPNKNTKIYIPFDGTTATDNSFITFVDRNAPIIIKKKVDVPVATDNSRFKVSLMLDINPDAEIQLQIDPKAGDAIKGTGYGNMRIDFDVNTSDLKIFGNYTIENGSYLFTFQNAIRRDFKVKEGSTLNWSGEPYSPSINLNAFYQTNASLTDILDPAILQASNRTTVPVQCIMNLTGNLMQPNIRFDLNLPNSEEELNRALKATVNTDELMNMQIVYLLVIGRFYTPEYMKSTTTPIGQNDLLAVASSTLSSQLNNWASQIFDNWNFGVNFRTTGEGTSRSNEYEFNFLYTPNNRITLNGNVGYRDNSLTASKVIGDFDFEYKLIQSGKLSAKAYTHTNDYNEFKSALTTQGVGLVYRESFNNLPELFASWKKSLTPKSKEERAAIKAAKEKKKAAKKAQKEAVKPKQEQEEE